MSEVESVDESYFLCSAYLMADLHYFEQNNDGGDMDLAFEDDLDAFVRAALERRGWEPNITDVLYYKLDLVSFMLPIFELMEVEHDVSRARDELDAVRGHCAELGTQHEKTRGIFP